MLHDYLFTVFLELLFSTSSVKNWTRGIRISSLEDCNGQISFPSIFAPSSIHPTTVVKKNILMPNLYLIPVYCFPLHLGIPIASGSTTIYYYYLLIVSTIYYYFYYLLLLSTTLILSKATAHLHTLCSNYINNFSISKIFQTFFFSYVP